METPPVESDLVSRAQSGDDDAIAEITRLYQPQLTRYAYKATGHAADAEDIAQAALAKALTRLDQFEQGTNLRAWLFAVTRSALADWRRAASRNRVSLPGDEALASIADAESAQHDKTGVFAYAKATLPVNEYRAVWMKYVELACDKEIARTIGKSPGAVRVMLTRARRKLSSFREDHHA